jgi:UDPglucose 6-dehydrogenase
MQREMRISVIGLGRLGSPLAAVLAAAGHRVVGVDPDPRPVRAINEGRAPVHEPGLQATVDTATGRLSATESLADATREADVSFIVVPTPSEADGRFSNAYVIEAVKGIGEALRQRPGHRHLVVVTSTVMPGATGGPIREALERSSGLLVGTTIGLCYSPEFIALGSVVHDILNADLLLVGESDPASGLQLAEILAGVARGSPPVIRMSLVDAELAKLAVNTFVTTKISYANMLSEICDGLPGSNINAVTAAVGLDSRIGGKYLRAATPYGGPCFPRDNVAIARLAQDVGTTADIAAATQAINGRQVGRLAGIVSSRCPQGSTIGMLGLSYKPDTPVVVESAGLTLAAELARRGYRVVVHDPIAMANAEAILGDTVSYAASAKECLSGAAVLITTAWPAYSSLTAADFPGGQPRPLVVDCWGLLDPTRFSAVAEVVRLGVPRLA